MTQSRALKARRQLYTELGLIPGLCGSGLRSVQSCGILKDCEQFLK